MVKQWPRAIKHQAVVSAARKSKSETLLTGEARDAEDIQATQENPSTYKAASVSLSSEAGKEEVSVVTTENLTSQLEPHAANAMNHQHFPGISKFYNLLWSRREDV